jgi:hypothetical protein
MRKRASAVLLFFWTIAWPGEAQRGDPAGVVMSADGSWRMEGRALRRGETVTAGVALAASQAGGLLLDCGNRRGLSYTCKAGECRVLACALQGINVQVDRVELPQTGVFAVVGNLLSPVTNALLKRQPREPAIAAARQGGNPADAVLRLDARGLHLGPAFGRVLADTYCVRLSPLPEGAARSLSVNWDRDVDAEGAVAAPGLLPGLYQLEKGRAVSGSAPCVPDADGVPGWALIAAPGDYDRLAATWREHAATAAALDAAGAAATVVVATRHAILAGLAESVPTR